MESVIGAPLKADPAAKAQVREKQLLKTCQEFGSILVSYMIKTMRSGSADGDDQDLAKGVYQDMFYDQVAKIVGKSNTLGIGNMLYTQMARMDKSQGARKSPADLARAQEALSAQISLNKTANSAD
ncbi:MAG: rod-binding protein [Syntrophobacteraceae bacterium]